MNKIEASKLNRSLSSVLEQVAQGESFALTRYGKEVAHITPPRRRRRTTNDVPGPNGEAKAALEPTDNSETRRQRQRDALLAKIRSKQQ